MGERSRNRWRILVLIVILGTVACTEEDLDTITQANDGGKDLFAPRMDYDQWKPLGRGDPLKNDPTYDYVPPVLDRVHYWVEPTQRQPDGPLNDHGKKTEILLLGVSSKKPSSGSVAADSRKDTYDSFMKFVDGPKFNHHQRIARPNFGLPLLQHYTASFFNRNKSQFGKGSEQRIPYTIMMPPPRMVTKNPTNSNLVSVEHPVTPLTTSGTTGNGDVTVQHANLIYQSTSPGGLNDWKTTSSTQKTKPFRDEIVFQKHLQPPESYIQIQFAPAMNLTHKPLIAANSDQTVNYVTAPPPLLNDNDDGSPKIKGQVSDDNLDISNTYVKFGKTEAQMHSTAGDDNLPEIILENPPIRPMTVFSHIKHPMITPAPLLMQTIESMETMQPPPLPTSPIFHNPKPETTPEMFETTTFDTTTTTTTTTNQNGLTTDPLFKHYKQPAEPLRGPLYLIIQGHSKVKTYKPTNQLKFIKVQETNEIGDGKEDGKDDDLKVKPMEFLKDFPVVVNGKGREGRSGDLTTLKHVIQTKLGAIDFSSLGDAAKRRMDHGDVEDVKETELEVGYKVVDGADFTSEKYHKGIVEAARKLEIL